MALSLLDVLSNISVLGIKKMAEKIKFEEEECAKKTMKIRKQLKIGRILTDQGYTKKKPSSYDNVNQISREN